jgi:hypothetical protein
MSRNRHADGSAPGRYILCNDRASANPGEVADSDVVRSRVASLHRSMQKETTRQTSLGAVRSAVANQPYAERSEILACARRTGKERQFANSLDGNIFCSMRDADKLRRMRLVRIASGVPS